MDTGMTNRIAKYLEPEPDEDSKRVIASVCSLLAIDAIHHNFRQTTWNELPDHLKPDVESIYNSFCGEQLSLILSAEFYKQFFAAMNSMGDVVTARYNELKGSK